MSVAGTAQGTRCAVHPARRAAGTCPVCARPRCGVDVAAYAVGGCAACATTAPQRPRASAAERLVRASVAAFAVSFAGAWVAAQYVDTQYFALVAPALVGVGCAWAATAAGGPALTRACVAIAAVAAVLGTALSDRLVPGGQNLFLPASPRLPPYLAAVIGALVWPVLFGPPRQRS
jgi:hypothetical protein